MTSILKADNIQDADGNNIINESSNTITIGASGDTTNVIGTLNKDGVAVANTPAFEATLTSMTNPGDATFFKGTYNTEVYDTAGAYDNSSNYRFTPQTAGKYFIYQSANFDAQATDNFGSCKIAIYKNGSSYRESYFDEYNNYYSYAKTPYLGTVVDMNGSSDYVEGYCYFNIITGTSYRVTYGVFGGYKIIE